MDVLKEPPKNKKQKKTTHRFLSRRCPMEKIIKLDFP